jgi:threonine dehydrogenase-like Zn-dependent dehydrogenase
MTTQTSNLSCLLYGPHDARFEDRQVPVISDPYDVIIRIAYVGVCGSDVSLLSVDLKDRGLDLKDTIPHKRFPN